MIETNALLSEAERMLQKAARDFLVNKCTMSFVREMEEDGKDYPLELWQEIADLGWVGIMFPEKYGGSGLGFTDLCILLEEMGYACLPGPFFTTVILGGLPLLNGGSEEQKQQFLPRIASGQMILTLALTEEHSGYDARSIATKAVMDKEDWIISGTKLFVPYAHVANRLLCVARTNEEARQKEGLTIFIVDTDSLGIEYTPMRTIACSKLFEVRFNNVRVPSYCILGQLGRGGEQVEVLLARAAVAKCHEMIGGMERVLEMTVSYAKERVQFGRPIGSFQVIQHYCSEMAIYVLSLKIISAKAARKINEDIPCSKDAAMAKAWACKACRSVISLAHQIHGAIGWTMDHDLQLYSKRLTEAEVTFGDEEFHLDRVMKQLGL